MRVKAQHINGMFDSILMAFANREVFLGTLPPSTNTDGSGRPLSSWRYTLIPFLERPGRLVLVDRKWDCQENAEWRCLTNRVYCFDSDGEEPQSTGVVAITGPGTAFDVAAPRSMVSLPGSTILIVETCNSGLHWMEPGDMDIRTLPPSIGGDQTLQISGNTPLGFFVGFADMEVWLLRSDIPFDTVNRFLTIAGAESSEREKLLGNYRVSFK
jgi:hypothetical protein